ncbi:hypothetical protein NIES2100_65800 [Calothrix sp. NIES-2100]|nr:hypothetical protein NIES2100_65800 [Calothrix sp. NIES-2100]
MEIGAGEAIANSVVLLYDVRQITLNMSLRAERSGA